MWISVRNASRPRRASSTELDRAREAVLSRSGQPRRDLRAFHRTRDVEALHDVAPELDEAVPLALRLDALGHDLESEAVAQVDGRLHDGRARSVDGANVLDEGPVDLHLLERQLVEVRERRVAGAEVIQREAHPDPAELAQGAHGALRLGEEHALGDLEAERRGARPGGPKRAGDPEREERIEQASRGEIHR